MNSSGSLVFGWANSSSGGRIFKQSSQHSHNMWKFLEPKPFIETEPVPKLSQCLNDDLKTSKVEAS